MHIKAMIIILFLLGAFLGFKRGFTRELVSFVGLIIVLILSYILKDPIASFLYTYLPFFRFGGILKGAIIFNILLYEWTAFFIVWSLLMVVFRLLTFTTKIFEKILKATLILGLPSKILGMIIGLLEAFVITYIILFTLSLPFFKENNHLKWQDAIVNKTPILSSFGKKTRIVSEKFIKLKEKYKEEDTANFHLETLDLFLEYKVISVENVEKLVKKDKLKLHNIDTVLQKYK